MCVHAWVRVQDREYILESVLSFCRGLEDHQTRGREIMENCNGWNMRVSRPALRFQDEGTGQVQDLGLVSRIKEDLRWVLFAAGQYRNITWWITFQAERERRDHPHLSRVWGKLGCTRCLSNDKISKKGITSMAGSACLLVELHFFKTYKNYILCVWMFCLHMCMCTPFWSPSNSWSLLKVLHTYKCVCIYVYP